MIWPYLQHLCICPYVPVQPPSSCCVSNCVLSLNMSRLSLCTEGLRSVLCLVTVSTNTCCWYTSAFDNVCCMQRASFTDLCCICYWLKELHLFLESLFFSPTASLMMPMIGWPSENCTFLCSLTLLIRTVHLYLLIPEEVNKTDYLILF